MKKVYKYPLPLQDIVYIDMPIGARVLDAQSQGPGIVLWALVDTEALKKVRVFRIAGTGHPITEEVAYISTMQFHDGALVLHVFEIVAPEATT